MKINDSFKPLSMGNSVNPAGTSCITPGTSNYQPSKSSPSLTSSASARIDRQYKEMNRQSSAMQVSHEVY